MTNTSFHQKLAQVIIQHRKVAGLTQLQLAELADVGKTVIFDLEHAKPSVRLDTLLKVLYVLNVTLELSSPLGNF